MSTDIVAEALREALAHVHLDDPLDEVLRRGRRLRRARRARRAAVPGVALVLAGVLGFATLDSPAVRRSPIVLSAAELPVCPVSLARIPAGLDISTDLDGGRLRVFYTDDSGRLVGLTASRTRPSGELGGDKRRVQVQGQIGVLTTFNVKGTARTVLVWRHPDGLWIRMIGQSTRSDPDRLLALANDVVNNPISLSMRVRVAPDGWTVRHYKDLGDGGVASFEDPHDASRGLTVALHRSTYPGFDVNDLEYRGPVTNVVVQGQPAHLVQGSQGWYLAATTSQNAWFTVQAPADMTSDQVLQIADGIRPA